MENQVEFEVPFSCSSEVTHLAEFFRSIATPNIREKERLATKSFDNVIFILVTIVAPWAASRYILNPLADRAEEWWQAVSPLQKPNSSTPSKRFSIAIRFDDFEVDMTEASDPKALKQAMKYIVQASQFRQKALEQDILLRKI